MVALGLLVLAAGHIDVQDATACLDVAAATDAVNMALAAAAVAPSSVDVEVAIAAAPEAGSTLRLTVRRAADDESSVTLLARAYALGPEDCALAPTLLRAVLGQYFADFPFSGPPPPLIAEVVAPWSTRLHIFGSLGARLVPEGGMAQAGARVAIGSPTDALALSLGLAIGAPQPLGQGGFVESYVLAGAGWLHTWDAWAVRAEVRAGPLWVAGYDYATNLSGWLAWVEGVAAVYWRWGDAFLGLEAAGGPLEHVVEDLDGARRTVPRLRLALVAELALASFPW